MKRKHLLHFLLVALLLVTLVAVSALSASAATPADADVFEVFDASGTHLGYAETFADAKPQMAAGFTLKVLKNTTADLVLDMDFAYSIDATGVTVTGSVTQSAGTVTVKGGTFTTAGNALWTVSGTANLVVENGSFYNTNAGDTTAASSVGSLFLFTASAKGSVDVRNGTLNANATLFFFVTGTKVSDTEWSNTKVNLTFGAGVKGNTKKYAVYMQTQSESDIVFEGGTWEVGRLTHICGGGGEGSVTIQGGTYHALYVSAKSERISDYNSKCLIQGENDQAAGLYIGRNFSLTIQGGTFTFDGGGIATWNNNKPVQILGGTFRNALGASNKTKKQVMLFMQNVTNPENRIENATFEAWGSVTIGSGTTNRGVIWLDIAVYMTFGEGTKVIAHNDARAIHASGGGAGKDKYIIFNGGTYTAENGSAYQDSGANPLAGNGGVWFCGGTFSSGIVGDNGVICMASGATYVLDGVTVMHTSPNASSNVLLRAMGVAAVYIRKGTFTGANFLRMGGSSASADKSAFVLIDPVNDSDVTVSSAKTGDANPLIWFEGNAGYRPTLIIRGGTYTRSNKGYLFTLNNGAYGNVTITGGNFTATNAGLFGIWTHNQTTFRVLGGRFSTTNDFICHSPGGASAGKDSQVRIDIYGKGSQVAVNLPTLNSFSAAVVKMAGLDSQTAYTSAGVTANGRIILVNTEGYTGYSNTLNIYGGSFTIVKGASYNFLNVGKNVTTTVNIYDGAFRNEGGTSRFIKSEGGATTLNFYGGTFTSELGSQEFIAFNGSGDGCSDVVHFYGAGEYDDIQTSGVTILHKGRLDSNSALILTCDGNNNRIDVTISGGTFEIYGGGGGTNMFFSWNCENDLYIEGGTFRGATSFSRQYVHGNIYIKDATIIMEGGLNGLFLIFPTLRDTVTATIDPTSTVGSFTVYRGTEYEATCDWKTFFAGKWNINAGRFDLASAAGVAAGSPAGSLEELVSRVNGQYPAITLLGDVILNTTLKVTKDLTIFANGKMIHSVCNPFEVADGVTLTIVGAVMEDDVMLNLGSGNVVLKNCTLNMFGAMEMIRLGGTANLTLDECTLSAPVFTAMPGNDSVYNGTYLLLSTDYKGTVTITGGLVMGGAKLIFAVGNENGGADGAVVITEMAFELNQFVVYDMWTCGTSYTLVNCTSGENVKKIFHICGSSVKQTKAPVYTISGGEYRVTENLVYIGDGRSGILNLIDVTAELTDENGVNPLLHVNCVTLNIDGGTYTQNGNNSVLLYYSEKVAGTGERNLATATIRNATFISYNGVKQKNTDWYYESALMFSCGVRAVLENCTVKALGKIVGNVHVTVGYAIGMDGGAECVIRGGYYTINDANLICIATNNVYNKLTIEDGTFTMEDATAARSLIWNQGGTTVINGGNFLMPDLPHNGALIGGTYGSADLQTNITINGGSFISENDTDAAISADGAAITINGGYFASKGMCVVRVLSGKTGSETNGVVSAVSCAKVNINGGLFVLLAGGRSGNYVAVVRAGGSTNYGTFTINGGTFINQRGDEENATVIFKNNAASSMTITGGTFLIANPTKAGVRSFFYRSNGYIDSTGTVANTPVCNVTVFGKALSGTEHAEVSEMSHTAFAAGGTTYLAYGRTKGSTELVNSDVMEDGAQVRLRTEEGGVSGLRFISTFSKETLDALKALAASGETVEYGTLITTTENVISKANGVFTVAALGAENEDKTFVRIVAKDGITMNADGSMQIRAALVNIKVSNYEKSFSAIAYAKVGDTYYYGDFSIAENSRSIAEVATKALADATGTLPCYDENGAATGANTSKYTKEQQKLLYRYTGIDWEA